MNPKIIAAKNLVCAGSHASICVTPPTWNPHANLLALIDKAGLALTTLQEMALPGEALMFKTVMEAGQIPAGTMGSVLEPADPSAREPKLADLDPDLLG